MAAPKRLKQTSPARETDPRDVEAQFIKEALAGPQARTKTVKKAPPVPRNVSPAEALYRVDQRAPESAQRPGTFHHAAASASGDFELADVRRYAQQLGYVVSDAPTHLAPPRLLEHFALIRENLDTLWEAMEVQDLASLAEALVCTVYATKLMAVSLGLPWEDLWELVHAASVTKVPGAPRFGYTVNPVPGANWQPPDVLGALTAAGYDLAQWFDTRGQPRQEGWRRGADGL